MKKNVIGDYCWFSSATGQKGEFNAQTILTEENRLTHSYNQVLLEKPSLIRTPTAQCNNSYLKSDNLQHKIEAIHNIAVAAGRDAIAHMEADTLLAGTIGSLPPTDKPLHLEEYERIFGEPAIYLVDKGVDVLLLDGFSNFYEFQVAVRSMRRLNSVPIPLAAFFRLELFDPDICQRVFQFAEQMELELIGLDLPLNSIETLPADLFLGDGALGFQIRWREGDEPTEERFKKIISKLNTYDPSLLLGGEGVDAKAWNRFARLARQG